MWVSAILVMGLSSGNTGGGFYSEEWVSFQDIQEAFDAWPEDKPITSMALRPLFHGKSVNTPSFMLAVLTAEGLLEPMPNRKRVHQTRHPGEFLAHVEELKAKAGITAKKPVRKSRANSAAKEKATPKVKAKAPRKAPAKKASTARKPRTASRKGK